MAGLRSLLDKYDQITNTDVDRGDVEPTYWQGCQWTHAAGICHSELSCCDAYVGTMLCQWCVPAGTSCITFHIWGAGGGGAGACCCQQGVPGGSGAYAYKSISATPGDTYDLCAGWNGICCSRTCRGCRGYTSYITGNGLSNFCAEGGYGGKSCCFAYWRFCCTGRTQGYWYMDNCSERAPYYGADGGACGNAGFAYSYCGCDTNNCWWKQGVPFPGGLTNKEGGHVHVRVQGNACIHDWTTCAAGFGAGTGSGWLSQTPGMGGVTASSCGGGCCHAYSGGAWGGGLVKIEYR